MPWHITMLIRIFLFSLILWVYFWWRISNAFEQFLRISPSMIKLAVFLIILFINSLPLIILSAYWTGNQQSLFLFRQHLGWQDYVFNFPYWCGFLLLIEVLPYLLLLDVLGLTFRLVRQELFQQWAGRLAILKISLLIFFGLYVGVRTYRDTWHVRLKPVRIPVTNLPDALNNLKLVLLGDIHLDRYTGDKKLKNFPELMRVADGDIVLFSGDLISRGQHFVDRGIDLLCDIKAPAARIACMGDHDFWSNPSGISGGLEKCGWTFLENAHRIVHHNGKRILISGITYIYSQRLPRRDINKILAAAPDADLKILLVHQPAQPVIEAAARYGYDLLLAGHTHGGQFVFKPFGITITPTQLENQFFSGYGNYENLHIVVTNGIGLTLAPLRYRAPAEISRIELITQSP
ncbi:metallophosphoesterase [candidate division KSB1 bacterium]|nr:metallophosphoesterase [candidate division KSB1 bacterium]